MKTIIIDNFDSFTYNLRHYLEAILDETVDVVRNNELMPEQLEPYDGIVLSPGPGLPANAGITQEVIRTFAGRKRILGVCLGHQAIGEVYGGRLKNLSMVHHGVTGNLVPIASDYLFRGIAFPCAVGRYHSWVIDCTPWPDELEILATDEQGEVMALRHRRFDLRGVQFHPESIMTDQGYKMMQNWALYRG